MKLTPWKLFIKRLGADRDIFIILALSASVYALSSFFEIFHRFSAWSGNFELFNIDELIIVFSFISFAIALLYIFRLRDLKKEMDKRDEIEEALRKSEYKYRLVVENVTDGIVIAQDGRIRYMNPKVSEISGFTQEEILGTPFSDLVHENDRKMVQEQHELSLQKNAKIGTYDFRAQDKSGNTHWIRNFGIPVEWEDRPASLNFLSDITEEREAEIKLKSYRNRLEDLIKERTAGLVAVNDKLMMEIESHKQTAKILKEKEKFLSDIFDAIQDGINVLDCGLNIVRSNSWFRQMYPDTLPHMGKKCYHVYHGRNSPCAFCPSMAAIETGKVKAGVVPYRSARSSEGWLELSAFPLRNQRGEIIGVIEHVKDITLRKAAEDARQESEARLMAILDVFEGYIYIADKDHRIEFMNRALIERFGHDARGESCFRVMYNLDSPCPWCKNRRVFNGETCKFEKKSSMDDRWYYTVETPIFDADGKVKKKQAVIIDITEQKLAHESLRESEKNLRKENIILKSSIKERYKFGDIIGKSRPMQSVYNLIVQAAATDANVIVYGESGTGKELVAKAIHEMSSFHNKNFVPVNCGAIPENLLESEFFGYKKGAFSGAFKDKGGYLDLAENGTLFLDEIGELGLNMQVKLLRAIEGGGFRPVGGNRDKKSEMRIIAATNRNLADHVEKGLMREDFYYRIHVIPIHLPPLRERKEDLLLLLDHFLKIHGGGEKPRSMPGKVIEAMQNYDWPGNIRELQNVLQRYLSLDELHFTMPDTGQKTDPKNGGDGERELVVLKEAVHNFEKDYIRQVLASKNWHRRQAAETLGIDRRTLQRKMKIYELGNMRQ